MRRPGRRRRLVPGPVALRRLPRRRRARWPRPRRRRAVALGGHRRRRAARRRGAGLDAVPAPDLREHLARVERAAAHGYFAVEDLGADGPDRRAAIRLRPGRGAPPGARAIGLFRGCVSGTVAKCRDPKMKAAGDTGPAPAGFHGAPMADVDHAASDSHGAHGMGRYRGGGSTRHGRACAAPAPSGGRRGGGRRRRGGVSTASDAAAAAAAADAAASALARVHARSGGSGPSSVSNASRTNKSRAPSGSSAQAASASAAPSTSSTYLARPRASRESRAASASAAVGRRLPGGGAFPAEAPSRPPGWGSSAGSRRLVVFVSHPISSPVSVGCAPACCACGGEPVEIAVYSK